MELQAKLIIVPDWVTEVLKANNLPPHACLDLVVLKRIMSQADVSFYLGLNEYLYDSIPEAIRESFRGRLNFIYCNVQDMMKYCMTNANGNRPSPDELQNTIDTISRAQYAWGCENPRPDVVNFLPLLPYMQEVDTTPTNPGTDYLFEVFNLREQVFGVRFYLPAKDSPFIEQLAECYSRAIETLQIAYNFRDVARTRIFQEYVTLSCQHRKPI